MPLLSGCVAASWCSASATLQLARSGPQATGTARALAGPVGIAKPRPGGPGARTPGSTLSAALASAITTSSQHTRPLVPCYSAAGAAAPAAAADSFFWKACLSISKSSRLGPRPAQPPAKLRSAPHSCDLELDVSGPKFTRTHRSHFITQQVPATTACLILRLDRSLYRAAGRQPRFRRRQQRSP
jgi:hypothetical protein